MVNLCIDINWFIVWIFKWRKFSSYKIVCNVQEVSFNKVAIYCNLLATVIEDFDHFFLFCLMDGPGKSFEKYSTIISVQFVVIYLEDFLDLV